MLMADVFSIALAVVGLFLALQGLWLGARALAPNGCAAAELELQRRRGSTFVVGLLTTGLTLVLAVGLSKVGGPGQAAALLLLAGWLLVASVGVSALATLVGERLPSPVDARRPWRRTVRGGLVLEFAFLFPLLGWFVLLPLALIIGVAPG
jgi:hypothetical protein